CFCFMSSIYFLSGISVYLGNQKESACYFWPTIFVAGFTFGSSTNMWSSCSLLPVLMPLLVQVPPLVLTEVLGPRVQVRWLQLPIHKVNTKKETPHPSQVY